MCVNVKIVKYVSYTLLLLIEVEKGGQTKMGDELRGWLISYYVYCVAAAVKK